LIQHFSLKDVNFSDLLNNPCFTYMVISVTLHN